jgi:uncharacterized coiled-coil protein SlyX
MTQDKIIASNLSEVEKANERIKMLEDKLASIKQAIAELESQEPVAHQKWCASLTQLLLSMPPQPAPCNCHPPQPPQRTWVWLTDEEHQKIIDANFSAQEMLIAAETKSKEKNK